MYRRMFLKSAAAAALIGAARADIPFTDPTAGYTFDELWRTIAEKYCFFDSKATDWERVREVYRPLAVAAPTYVEFVDVLRRTLNELYDRHTVFFGGADGTVRYPWFDLDVEAAGDNARVTEVRDGSEAAHAGIHPGDTIIAVDGVALPQAAAPHRPICLARPDAAAERWALNTAVAGRRAGTRRLRVESKGKPRDLVLAPIASKPAAEPDVSSRRLEGGAGYIRLTTFADKAVIASFDAALETLRNAPGLILDVRGNGGGDTIVSKPIMGRFIREQTLFAYMRRRDGARLGDRWQEIVQPRGPFTFEAPVVVLVNFWSGSLAEGFAMAMRGMKRARVVGRPMMRLGAGVYRFRLDQRDIEGQYSAEPVYDVDDRPRDDFRPDVVTAPGADILAAGLSELGRMTKT